MHFTLIYPPLYFRTPDLPAGQGASQNLGLGYLASYLARHGFGTKTINAFNLGIDTAVHAPYKGQDLYRVGLPFDDIVSRLPQETDYACLSIPFSNAFPVVRELASAIRCARPHLGIIMGGVHASTFPHECLRAGADLVVEGEGEIPMLAIARGAPPAEVPGVHVLKNGVPVSGGPPGCPDSLDDIPFPQKSADDVEICAKHPPRGGAYHKTISLITSRGCPFGCRFCSIHPVCGRRWRARSARNVLDEIEYWHSTYGIRHFEFEDDNLTLDRDRALAIFDGISARYPDVTWAAHNGVRIDTLDESLVSAMKRSGCQQLNLAVESGTPEVLARMNKKLSLDKVEEVVTLCGRHGIKAAGFLLVGYPGETGDTFRRTISFFRRLRKKGLYAAIPLIVNAYPGTQLYDECREKGFLADGVEEHVFVEDDDFISIVTPDFDRAKVIRWKKQAARRINGGRIRRLARRVKQKLASMANAGQPIAAASTRANQG
ncbi:MAG: radical SAM protein [Chitinivibrionales bacterium]|nr:radical SAM protein [Chitinivibrionales bacterium]MBD3396572.1 radical SAM protein [Chitinivibrionales bacterium]